MSITLLRKSSDTPNITNRNDARMIRYAYGGMDGVIKNFGNELSYSTSGSVFHMNSGCVVIQGWEIEIDSWELNLGTISGTQHYSIYLEVNVAAEIAEIKSTYKPAVPPVISTGDDLTKYPEGIARIPLYTFKYSYNNFESVSRLFSLIEYGADRLSNIEERLAKLGFREGVVIPVDDSTVETNILKRQGNYVIGKFSARHEDGFPYITEDNYMKIGSVPPEFVPETTQTMYGTIMFREPSSALLYTLQATITINSEGILFYNGVVPNFLFCQFTIGYEAKQL